MVGGNSVALYEEVRHDLVAMTITEPRKQAVSFHASDQSSSSSAGNTDWR